MKNPRRINLPPLLPDIALRVYAPLKNYAPPITDDLHVGRRKRELRGWQRDSSGILFEGHQDHRWRWQVVRSASSRLNQLREGNLGDTPIGEYFGVIWRDTISESGSFQHRVQHHAVLFLDGMVGAVVSLTLGGALPKGDSFVDIVEYGAFLEEELPSFGQTALGRAALDDRARLTELLFPGHRRGKYRKVHAPPDRGD